MKYAAAKYPMLRTCLRIDVLPLTPVSDFACLAVMMALISAITAPPAKAINAAMYPVSIDSFLLLSTICVPAMDSK